MKEYEVYSDLKVPKNSKIILRLDGRGFHSLSKLLNLEKPYDSNFSDLMVDVSLDIFKEFSPIFSYTFSDEISLILDEIPFNGRIEKLDSVIASFASSSFSFNLNNYFKNANLNKPISFDSRVIPIKDCDIPKYFKWRQDESWRNCVNSYGIWVLKNQFSDKLANEKIKGLKYQEIHDLLFDNGINLNDVDNWKKRGICLYKKDKEVFGFNKKKNKEQSSFRKYIYKDYNIPKFSSKFFNDIDIID